MKTTDKLPVLTRAAAIEALELVLGEKKWVPAATNLAVKKFGVPGEEISFVANLVNGTLKNLLFVDYVLVRLLKDGKFPSQYAKNAMRIGAYQVINPAVPDYAAVDTTVDALKLFSAHPKEVALVNAVLRNFIRKWRDFPLPDDPVEYLSVKYSHPRWLVKLFLNEFGRDEAEKLMSANNQPPPRTFRVNTTRIPPRNLYNWLRDEGFSFKPNEFFEEYFALEDKVPVAKFPPMEKGWVSVQDAAFAVPVLALKPLPGKKILEVGAAPGGKTTHIAEILSGKVRNFFAIDISADKMPLVVGNFARLGMVPPNLVVADFLRAPLKKFVFDKVLIDAPCSALGVIRRHPEIRYFRRPEDIRRLAKVQKKMIVSAKKVLKRGGIVVFTTCTITSRENAEVVEFARSEGFEVVPAPEEVPLEFMDGGFYRTFPHRHNLDGSFTAVLWLRR